MKERDRLRTNDHWHAWCPLRPKEFSKDSAENSGECRKGSTREAHFAHPEIAVMAIDCFHRQQPALLLAFSFTAACDLSSIAM